MGSEEMKMTRVLLLAFYLATCIAAVDDHSANDIIPETEEMIQPFQPDLKNPEVAPVDDAELVQATVAMPKWQWMMNHRFPPHLVMAEKRKYDQAQEAKVKAAAKAKETAKKAEEADREKAEKDREKEREKAEKDREKEREKAKDAREKAREETANAEAKAEVKAEVTETAGNSGKEAIEVTTEMKVDQLLKKLPGLNDLKRGQTVRLEGPITIEKLPFPLKAKADPAAMVQWRGHRYHRPAPRRVHRHRPAPRRVHRHRPAPRRPAQRRPKPAAN